MSDSQLVSAVRGGVSQPAGGGLRLQIVLKSTIKRWISKLADVTSEDEEGYNLLHWSKLYPSSSSEVTSVSFDIPLLMVLLRTICNLSPPPAGWDTPPLTADTSCEADIARVRCFMNAVSKHAGEGFINDAVFNNYWQQIRDTLLRLGGARYGDAIDQMRDQEMDPLEEEHFRELLKQWRKLEDDIKDKLNELESEFNQSG